MKAAIFFSSSGCGTEHIFPQTYPLGSNFSLAQLLSTWNHLTHSRTFFKVTQTGLNFAYIWRFLLD